MNPFDNQLEIKIYLNKYANSSIYTTSVSFIFWYDDSKILSTLVTNILPTINDNIPEINYNYNITIPTGYTKGVYMKYETPQITFNTQNDILCRFNCETLPQYHFSENDFTFELFTHTYNNEPITYSLKNINDTDACDYVPKTYYNCISSIARRNICNNSNVAQISVPSYKCNMQICL